MPALVGLKSLAHLVLAVDCLEDRDDNWLKALQHMSALTHLSMTCFTNGTAGEILHLAQCTQLRKLTGGLMHEWEWDYVSKVRLCCQPGPRERLSYKSGAEPPDTQLAGGCNLRRPPVSLTPSLIPSLHAPPQPCSCCTTHAAQLHYAVGMFETCCAASTPSWTL
jgi:hypothetical protein